MLSKLGLLIAFLFLQVDVLMAAEEFAEERLALRGMHQGLLNAARSGDVDTLNNFLVPTEDSQVQRTPTAYDVRELFNAAFINEQLHVMQRLWTIPGLPEPVDLSYFGMDIDYPHTAAPYPGLKGFDDPNDIFSYNICSRTAFCHIYTETPNCNIQTTSPITYNIENNRWQFNFKFFKAAESAGRTNLVAFIVRKAYLYNKSCRPAELQKWTDFMRGKAESEDCSVVKNALTDEALVTFMTSSNS